MRNNIECTFYTYVTKSNGIQTLRFRAPSTELSNAMKVILQMHAQITAGIVLADGSKHKLGIYQFGGLSVDRDGQSVISLETDVTASSVGDALLREVINKNVTLVTYSKDEEPEEEDDLDLEE